MKKEYIKPTITVYKVEPTVILAASGPENALPIYNEGSFYIDDEEI